jgi:hypothetical protein
METQKVSTTFSDEIETCHILPSLVRDFARFFARYKELNLKDLHHIF